MHNFLANNRGELIARCKAKIAHRPRRAATEEQLRNGVPLFLEQLLRTLLSGQDEQAGELLTIPGASGGKAQALSKVGVTAPAHAKQLLELGFSLDQVVHDYGDLCQAITDLAVEQDSPFSTDEFSRLNRCLDNAIADAVAELGVQRDASIALQHSTEMKERLEFFIHELRNSLGTATLAVRALETGNLPLSGATGSVLKRSHVALNALVDRTFDEVRMETGSTAPNEPFSLAMFLADAASEAAAEAGERGCGLSVREVAPLLGIAGNRERLMVALANVLQNAIKYTQPHTGVTLAAYTHANRVFIEVQDHCGGLPTGIAEKMFIPFSSQLSHDETGLGLGLAIARQCVEADAGTLTAKNLPGTGCVFTISLPRRDLH
jgi:signal transduction histidine kinase